MPDVINSHFFEGTSLGFNGNTGYFSNEAVEKLFSQQILAKDTLCCFSTSKNYKSKINTKLDQSSFWSNTKTYQSSFCSLS